MSNLFDMYAIMHDQFLKIYIEKNLWAEKVLNYLHFIKNFWTIVYMESLAGLIKKGLLEGIFQCEVISIRFSWMGKSTPHQR